MSRAVIREDRELLAELARLNGDMAALGMRIMEGAATAAPVALPPNTVEPDR